jgi:hypothetical protein
MVEQREKRRGWHQRYLGPRANCESVPCLPAGVVAWVLDDPRRIPYLLLWQDRFSQTISEAVRVSIYSDPHPLDRGLDWTGWVEVKRTDGTRSSLVQTVQRALPRNGGKSRLVICPNCQRLRRALYAWEVNRSYTNSARVIRWRCRVCAGLRYTSEGGALVIHPCTDIGRLIEAVEGPSRSPRPEPWYPYIFANPCDAEAILSRQ